MRVRSSLSEWTTHGNTATSSRYLFVIRHCPVRVYVVLPTSSTVPLIILEVRARLCLHILHLAYGVGEGEGKILPTRVLVSHHRISMALQPASMVLLSPSLCVFVLGPACGPHRMKVHQEVDEMWALELTKRSLTLTPPLKLSY